MLENRRCRRVGGKDDYEVRARIVAATNRRLSEAIIGFVILFRFRQIRPAESALLLWSTVVIWTFMAAMAAVSKGGSTYVSSALLLGLIVVLVFLTFRFAQSAASTGLLSRRLFQEAGRRGLALAGAQQYVWDWQPEDQNLFVSEELEQALGAPDDP